MDREGADRRQGHNHDMGDLKKKRKLTDEQAWMSAVTREDGDPRARSYDGHEENVPFVLPGSSSKPDHPDGRAVGQDEVAEDVQRLLQETREAMVETHMFVNALCMDMRTLIREMATVKEVKRGFLELRALVSSATTHSSQAPPAAATSLPMEPLQEVRVAVKESPKWKIYTDQLRHNCLESGSEERLRRFVRPLASVLLDDIVGRGAYSDADVSNVVSQLATSLAGTRQSYKKYLRTHIREQYVQPGRRLSDTPPSEDDVRSMVGWLLARAYKGSPADELWSRQELIEDLRKLVLVTWATLDKPRERAGGGKGRSSGGDAAGGQGLGHAGGGQIWSSGRMEEPVVEEEAEKEAKKRRRQDADRLEMAAEVRNLRRQGLMNEEPEIEESDARTWRSARAITSN
eukprot:jgi/Mesvir1/23866/Mv10662-RA.1